MASASAWSLLLAVVAFFFLANVPGRIRLIPNMGSGKYGPDFACDEISLEHGWPWAFLRRDPPIGSQRRGELSLWKLWTGRSSFSAIAFVADAFVAAVFLAVALICHARWIRAARAPWQWSVGASLGLFTIVAAVCALAGVEFREYRREQRAIAQLSTRNRVSYEPGGPSWLRGLSEDRIMALSLGEQSSPVWRWLDRVVEVELEGKEVAIAKEFLNLRVVRPVGKWTKEQFRQLWRLPNLEAVDIMWWSGIELGASGDENDGAAGDSERLLHTNTLEMLSGIRNLRGLNLWDWDVIDSDMDLVARLQNLETLYLAGTEIGDEGLRRLEPLQKLRWIGLMGTNVTAAGVARLQAAHPGIEVDWVPE